MLNKLRLRRKEQTVMGHRLEEPRMTLMVVLWALVYIGLPLIVAGSLIDLGVQAVTGQCVGFWCGF
jgi:hypothetical protein